VGRVLDALRAKGGWWRKLHGSPFTHAGDPDIYGGYKGRFFQFEVKEPDGSLSAIQKWTIEDINRREAGYALMVREPEEALAFIEEVMNERV